MTAILGLSLGTVESLLAEAEGPVHLGNINADNQLVIAGSDTAMAAVAARAKALGASCARRLAMSVPSHCALLSSRRGSWPKPSPTSACARRGFATSAVPRRARCSMPSVCAMTSPSTCAVSSTGTAPCAPPTNAGAPAYRAAPGQVLTGLARRVFEQGTLVAFDGARLDTLDALLRQEGSQSR